MNVFEKLSAVEDEIFQEMARIDKEIEELRRKQRIPKDLGKSMNPKRFTKIKSKKTKLFLGRVNLTLFFYKLIPFNLLEKVCQN